MSMLGSPWPDDLPGKLDVSCADGHAYLTVSFKAKTDFNESRYAVIEVGVLETNEYGEGKIIFHDLEEFRQYVPSWDQRHATFVKNAEPIQVMSDWWGLRRGHYGENSKQLQKQFEWIGDSTDGLWTFELNFHRQECTPYLRSVFYFESDCDAIKFRLKFC